MRTRIVLLALLVSATPAVGNDEDPVDRALTPGWYRIQMGEKTFEQCRADNTAPVNAEADGCALIKLVEQGENFEQIFSCSEDEATYKLRILGVARPGYIRTTTQFLEVPEEMREFFKGSLVMEMRRLRDCTQSELSKARSLARP